MYSNSLKFKIQSWVSITNGFRKSRLRFDVRGWFRKPFWVSKNNFLKAAIKSNLTSYFVPRTLNLLPNKLVARSSQLKAIFSHRYRHPDARVCSAQSMQKNPPSEGKSDSLVKSKNQCSWFAVRGWVSVTKGFRKLFEVRCLMFKLVFENLWLAKINLNPSSLSTTIKLLQNKLVARSSQLTAIFSPVTVILMRACAPHKACRRIPSSKGKSDSLVISKRHSTFSKA